jgi:diguanylate cyclase (GGDEF)-like protein
MAEEVSAVLARSLQARIKRRENIGLLLLLLKMLLYGTLFAALMELFYSGSVTQHLDFRPTVPQLALGLFAIVGTIFVLDLITVANWGMIRRARTQLVDELARRDAAERISLLDPVTGTFDRRYLDEIIPREAARADRHETTLSFVKVSIDHFDSIDPTKGFQLGDQVLKGTAQLLKRVFRPTDIILRHGHADFLIILPETAKHGAMMAVRRLLTKVDELNRRHEFKDFTLQLSIGVSDHTKGKDVRDALNAVDARVEIYYDTQSPGA